MKESEGGSGHERKKEVEKKKTKKNVWNGKEMAVERGVLNVPQHGIRRWGCTVEFKACFLN